MPTKPNHDTPLTDDERYEAHLKCGGRLPRFLFLAFGRDERKIVAAMHFSDGATEADMIAQGRAEVERFRADETAATERAATRRRVLEQFPGTVRHYAAGIKLVGTEAEMAVQAKAEVDRRIGMKERGEKNKTKPDKDNVTRVVSVKLYVPSGRGGGHDSKCACEPCKAARKVADKTRIEIMNAMRVHRYAASTAASRLFMAEQACAVIIKDDESGWLKITPTTYETGKIQAEGKRKGKPQLAPNSRKLLEFAFGKDSVLLGEGMIDWVKSLYPQGYRNDLPEAAMASVRSAWLAKDTKQPKMKRGYAAQQGASSVPALMRIPLPFRPGRAYEIYPHEVKLSWKSGEWVNLNVPKLEPHQWIVWEKVCSGEWPAGAVALRVDEEGDFRLDVPYKRPRSIARDVSPDRRCEVDITSNPEEALRMGVTKGHERVLDDKLHDEISAEAALEILDRKAVQQDKIERMRGSCGSRWERKIGSGNPAAFDAISARGRRIAKERATACKVWCRTWVARIVNDALRWRCGEIEVKNLPKKVRDDPKSGGLCMRTWPWSEFMGFLKQRCYYSGIKLIGDDVEEEGEAEVAASA